MDDPLPPAEQAELERRWAEDPENPANKMKAVMGPDPEGPYPPVVLSTPRFEPVPVLTPVTGQAYLSVIDKLPLTDEQKIQVKMWTFEGAAQRIMLDTAKRLDEMQEAFGLAPKKEVVGDTVPTVRRKKTKVPEQAAVQGVQGTGSAKVENRKRTGRRRQRKNESVEGAASDR